VQRLGCAAVARFASQSAILQCCIVVKRYARTRAEIVRSAVPFYFAHIQLEGDCAADASFHRMVPFRVAPGASASPSAAQHDGHREIRHARTAVGAFIEQVYNR
jgi:hypothetical protein